MRIVVAGPQWRARWTQSVEQALDELGHDVSVLAYPEPTLVRGTPRRLPPWARRAGRALLATPLTRLRQSGYAAFGQQLRAHVGAVGPDLLLLLRAEVLPPAALTQMRRDNPRLRVAAWWIDDPFRFPSALALGRQCAHFFVFSRHAVCRLRDAGVAGARYLPCGYDPAIYRPLDLSDVERATLASDVSFVGAYYPARGAVMQALTFAAPAIWGPGWKAALERGEVALAPSSIKGDDVAPEMMARVLNATRISLDIHHPQSKYGGLNMRAFEAAACGAFQLVDAIPDTADLFEPGAEMALYRDMPELRRLIDHYLARPDEASAIAARARARAAAEHTFRHRMVAMLDALG